MENRKTLKDHLLALFSAVLMVGFTLLVIEIGLRVIDPWGMRYFEDLEEIGNTLFKSHPLRGYTIPDGEYEFSTWNLRMVNDTRSTPNANTSAACRIGFLGDSVTFGYGVNDADVWINQLALEFPDVYLMNLGMTRYSSPNILGTFKAYPSLDAYLYLIINNDIDPAINPDTYRFVGSGEGLPWLIRYTKFFAYRGTNTFMFFNDPEEANEPEAYSLSQPNVALFFQDLAALTADPRVSIATFADEPLTTTMLKQGYTPTIWNYPPYPNSFVDPHLNAKGNLELAKLAQPLVQQIVETACIDRSP